MVKPGGIGKQFGELPGFDIDGKERAQLVRFVNLIEVIRFIGVGFQDVFFLIGSPGAGKQGFICIGGGDAGFEIGREYKDEPCFFGIDIGGEYAVFYLVVTFFPFLPSISPFMGRDWWVTGSDLWVVRSTT